jgi:hypothetical protein
MMKHDAQLTKGCSDGNVARLAVHPACVNELCKSLVRMVEKRTPIVPFTGLGCERILPGCSVKSQIRSCSPVIAKTG